MRISTVTVAGNEYLADRARRAGAAHVIVVPSSVDHTRYAVQQLQTPKGERPVIGWIGSPSTARYLQLIGPALVEVQRTMNARVVLVGSGSLRIPGVELEIHPWSETTEVGLIQSFDVGIMPIETTNWERGKCGFKLVQYMAAGIPSVATAFGANNDITVHGRTGFLAKTQQDWVMQLSKLLSDKTLCTAMGQEGRDRVRVQYSTHANGPKLVSAFKQALCDHRA